MKIVFIAPFGIRPKGTVIARMIPLAAAVQAAGHEVVIIAPPYTNPEDSGKCEIIRGVRLQNITLGPKNKVVAAPILAWRMFRAALFENPDVIHLFKPKGYGGLAAMLHLTLRRLGLRVPPLLLDTDDWEGAGGMNDLHSYSGAEKRFYQFQELWLLRNAAGVTVASRALEEMVATAGVDRSRIMYLPNCAGECRTGDGAAVRKQLGISSKIPVVLLYTRFFEFSQEKLYVLFDEMYRQVPEVRFLVVGQGRNGEEQLLLNAGRERGFAPALIMAGWVEPGSIADYLAVGDVAIYPFADTLVNRTKCPAKLTELLLAGVAVVADNVGQLAEYIDPAGSGVLCSPDDWQDMAGRAVSLLKLPEHRREVGLAGRYYLLQKFSWQAYALELIDFYVKQSA